jgi:hypothetical protein
MNEYPGVGVSRKDVVLNLVEWYHNMPDRGLIETQHQKRCCELSGDGYSAPGKRAARVGGCGRSRDHPGTVALADARSMSEERVAVREVGVRVQRHGRDLELPAQRALVQALDVGQLVRVAPEACVDSPGGERPEHEGIVGIRAVGHLDRPCRGRQESSGRLTRFARRQAVTEIAARRVRAAWPAGRWVLAGQSMGAGNLTGRIQGGSVK